MEIQRVIWKDRFIDKLEAKHGVETDEVEEVLFSEPYVRFFEKGRVKDENLYAAYGQTDTGRFLIVFFVLKPGGNAMPISARDMTQAERRYYERTR